MQPAAHSESGYTLAFETSSALGNVALGRGADVLEARSLGGPRSHGVSFLPTVKDLCRDHGVAPAEVSRVIVSIGPGSFTGLRIGIAAARMLALANCADVLGVPTLEVIAQNAAQSPSPPDRVAVILDAKRRRVYAATFRRQGLRYAPECAPAEVDPASFLAAQEPACAVLGEGVTAHRETVQASGLPILPDALFAPRAENLYSLGATQANGGCSSDRRRLLPLYVRPPEAEERWAARRGQPGA